MHKDTAYLAFGNEHAQKLNMQFAVTVGCCRWNSIIYLFIYNFYIFSLLYLFIFH